MTTPRRRQRGQVLILLGLWWLLFGGGAASALVVYDRSESETKKMIERVVRDERRKDAILTDIDRWESRQEQRDKEVAAQREQLLKILRRKDTRRSQTEPLTARLDATLLEMDQSFLNLRFRIKERVTSAEWAEIVARPNP